eukprot:3565398-Amphidinium_carterae.1
MTSKLASLPRKAQRGSEGRLLHKEISSRQMDLSAADGLVLNYKHKLQQMTDALDYMKSRPPSLD